ncbi:unnamed protein product [Adineta ricciae]|uniref:Uncharacterized protein n=1 Tax=Adineta ricciae TaxID=249248 RepID=A0A813SLM1_ADIRI|nr:unnamed protein product [Adineta ricciae]
MFGSTLRCTDTNGKRELARGDFDLKMMKEYINQIPSRDGYEECQIDIYVTSAGGKYSTIHFYGNKNKTKLDGHNQLTIQTRIAQSTNTGIDSPPLVWKTIEFTCQNKDTCNQQYLLDHFDLITSIDYSPLASALKIVLEIQKSRADYCALNNTDNATMCSIPTCTSIHIHRLNQSIQKCVDYDDVRIGIDIQADIDLFYRKDDRDSIGVDMTTVTTESSKNK